VRVDEIYRGYKIRYRRNRGWVANILPPYATHYLDTFPTASGEEGKVEIERRARNLIDAHISEL